MDVYASEEEQVEALKKWWKDNGNGVVIGLLLGLAGLFGWNTWQANTKAKQEEASLGYQQLLVHVAKKEAKDARYIGNNLITNYSDSPYASLSALSLAKLEVEDGQTAEARKHLQWVIANSKLPALKETAQVRIAAVSLSEGNADAALNELTAVSHCKQMVTCMELKGDILLAQGKHNDARSTYLQAISLAEADKSELSVIQLKLDDLGSSQ